MPEGYLRASKCETVAREGLAALPLDGRRVLVIIPDGTRTMPMPMMFEIARARARAARGGARLSRRARHAHADERCAAQRPRRAAGRRTAAPARAASSIIAGTTRRRSRISVRYPRATIADLTGGRLREDVPVALNRLATEYDHVLICGPVFPHEVAGFSGGTKYLFPGIAAPEIIHFTHWLGALITQLRSDRHDRHAGARRDRSRGGAAARRRSRCSPLVVTHDGVAGMYCGDVHEAWRQAATLSSQRHIVWVDEPFDRVLAIMPAMYDDLWTAAQGHLQERAGRRRRRRGDHLRAARERSEPRARPDDRRDRLSLPRLLPRAVGSVPADIRAASSRTRRT